MHKTIDLTKCCYPGIGGFPRVAVGLLGSGCVFVTSFCGKDHTVEKKICAQHSQNAKKERGKTGWGGIYLRS